MPMKLNKTDSHADSLLCLLLFQHHAAHEFPITVVKPWVLRHHIKQPQ